MKTLKLFNGRIAGSSYVGYIAASSKAAAIRLAESCRVHLTPSEMRNFWTCGHWGYNAIKTIGEPTEPCFWFYHEVSETFERKDKTQPIVRLEYDSGPVKKIASVWLGRDKHGTRAFSDEPRWHHGSCYWMGDEIKMPKPLLDQLAVSMDHKREFELTALESGREILGPSIDKPELQASSPV